MKVVRLARNGKMGGGIIIPKFYIRQQADFLAQADKMYLLDTATQNIVVSLNPMPIDGERAMFYIPLAQRSDNVQFATASLTDTIDYGGQTKDFTLDNKLVEAIYDAANTNWNILIEDLENDIENQIRAIVNTVTNDGTQIGWSAFQSVPATQVSVDHYFIVEDETTLPNSVPTIGGILLKGGTIIRAVDNGNTGLVNDYKIVSEPSAGGASITVGLGNPSTVGIAEGDLYYDKGNGALYVAADVGGVKWFQIA